MLQLFIYLQMRRIITYGNNYDRFVKKLSETERFHINRFLNLFRYEKTIPHHYIKYIDDSIYEFRINLPTKTVRIFFIYDGETLVVLFNAFVKKTQKTPRSEIEKAKQLKNSYYEAKRNKEIRVLP